MTEVVGEFPETQGLMGRRYAALQGEDSSVAAAIEEHYKPQGPNDRVPTDPVSVAVALADKLDTLVGFWAIDEKPTGSKDPYALRRAALGVIRIATENGIKLYPREVFEKHIGRIRPGAEYSSYVRTADDFQVFFDDRLEVVLREQGRRHDLVHSVLYLRSTETDLLTTVRRVEALGKFLDTDDGKNLLAGYRRAANILRAEEKKDGEGKFNEAPDASLLQAVEEKALNGALSIAQSNAESAVAQDDYEGAMRALSTLRGPVDSFFDKVTVNADNPALRANRLKLLNQLRAATRAVADFSKIAG